MYFSKIFTNSTLFVKISVGQVVMANYNPDEPDERGYWYDVKITKKVTNRKLFCHLQGYTLILFYKSHKFRVLS